MKWTIEQEQQLSEGIVEGLSASKIGLRMGITRNAVIGKASRMGLVSKKLVATPSKAKRSTKFRMPPKMPVFSLPLEEVAPEGGVTYKDLRPHHCRWPHGDPHAPDFHFCGNVRTPPGPYCAIHRRMSRT